MTPTPRSSYTMTELNQDTKGVLDAVRAGGEPVVITLRGRPVAVLSPLPDDIEDQVVALIRDETAGS